MNDDWNYKATNEKFWTAAKAIIVLGFIAVALWVIYDYMEGDDVDDDDVVIEQTVPIEPVPPPEPVQ
jgi:hypothetical protein